METRARTSGDVIRRVSKATAFLQAFAALLLVGLVYLMSGIYQRYEALQDGIRENALWSVYQLDREARRLNEDGRLIAARHDMSREAAKALSTRYDILYSRMSILKRANFDLRLSEEPELAQLVNRIEPIVLANESWFDQLGKGRALDRARLESFLADLGPLVRSTESLLTQVNNKVSVERADARTAVQSLQLSTGIVTALLSCCVAVLVVTLRRQLRSVRSAGLEFEGLVRELREAYAGAEAGNRAKSQFMATMGHEVRTPLNAILGTAELLELSVDISERTKAGVQTIRRSGESLLEILNEILDFAKMENGRIDVSPVPTEIVGVVVGAVDMIRDRAAEHGNDLIADIAEVNEGLTIMTDGTRVRQVVLNLLSNAVKFTRHGAVVLKMSLCESFGGPVLRFAVSDTGIGIDEQGLSKLFKPFSQVDASIGRKYGGTGLGLTICKEIVEALGGSIGVVSEKGHGSTFWFEIPALPAPAREALPEAEAVANSGAGIGTMPRIEILLVEDNPVNRQVAVGFLRRLGQEPVVAGDGVEALRAARERRFDLVLMDMQMPNMDGIEATRRMRRLEGWTATVPIVAMTANASDEDRRLCLEAGMTDFQSKPISLSQLAALVRSVRPSATQQPDPRAAGAGVPTERQRELIDVLGEEAFGELLDSFFADAVAILSNLADAMREGDPSGLDRMLHSLKGAAANVGFQDIAEQAQQLRRNTITHQDLLAIMQAVEERRLCNAA